MKKKKPGILAAFGSLSAVAGIAGTVGICCVPAFAFIFASLGIASCIFTTYSWAFYPAAMCFFFLAIYSLNKSRSCKKCKISASKTLSGKTKSKKRRQI